ncbi:MAG: dehydrogenase E1 component subunit alpha/beta [Ignavibacteriaceae bacterium]|nr:dehydrogenase E1 component subunit alpha/beta [Ignavibacteriaceae bacterium]
MASTDTEIKELKTKSAITYERGGLSNQTLTDIYYKLITPRLIEEKMLNLLRQGKISKWFSGIGQEAISVGTVTALPQDVMIMPLIRNLGIFTGRGIPLARLFSQFQGKFNGFTKGRDRSFHFGSLEHHICGMISHLGPQLALADGAALWEKLKGTGKCSVAFSGDGGTSQGDFHEALNVAAVWDLPVLFIVENNGYGLSTPTSQQYKCAAIADKGIGYGIESIRIDGNNVLEVYNTITSLYKKQQENPRPFLIEALTFRMRGHEEASGTKYVPKELFEQWGKKDPVSNYESFLIEEGVLTENQTAAIRERIKEEINEEWERSEKEPEVTPDTIFELNDMYPRFTKPAAPAPEETKREIRFIDAVSEGLKQSLQNNPELIVMGQDVADYGGVFKITDGFISEFGKERIRNTPLCESAIIGSALGYAVKGGKAVVEMQFADFVSCGFNQIVNNLAKINYRWEAPANVVVRLPCGGGVGAGPFHSQTNEAWFFHTPGLKIAYPSNPYDAKGLLARAIEDPAPVLFFEHKALYRSLSGFVPEQYYSLEFGRAAKLSGGNSVTIITYGYGTIWAKNMLEKFPSNTLEIIDLRTLVPIDYELIFSSVKKTGKVLILHEDTLTGGIGAEISARISRECFEYLDAPVYRSASLDTPVPFSVKLENNFLPSGRLEKELKELLAY